MKIRWLFNATKTQHLSKLKKDTCIKKKKKKKKKKKEKANKNKIDTF